MEGPLIDLKDLVRRFYKEVWNEGNLDFADEVFAGDYVRHDFRGPSPASGPEGQKQIAGDFRAAFPDLRFEPDFILADGDYVVGRWTAEGTNTGQWGDQGPTGKRVRFSGINVFRFENGKVAEIWNHRDDLGLLQQLGAEIWAGAKPQS